LKLPRGLSKKSIELIAYCTIERSLNSGEFKLLAEVGKNVSSFTDNTVNATDQYTFLVNVRPVIKLYMCL